MHMIGTFNFGTFKQWEFIFILNLQWKLKIRNVCPFRYTNYRKATNNIYLHMPYRTINNLKSEA